jgi:hypothetical protein
MMFSDVKPRRAPRHRTKLLLCAPFQQPAADEIGIASKATDSPNKNAFRWTPA